VVDASIPALTLDRNAEVPVGVQLAWILRARIAGGELKPGDRLPGARELAASAGVNSNTVRSVYARLEEEGLIEAQHGRGTFVAASATQQSVGGLLDATVEHARAAGVDPRELAAALYMHASLEPAQAGEARARPAAAPKKQRTGEAGIRRRLRDEIGALEKRLAQLDLPAAVEHPGAAPGAPAGTRLLSAAELTEVRDRLAAQVAAAEKEDTVRRAAAERRLAGEDEESHDAATATGSRAGRQRWEVELGHGRWTIPLAEG
jgi:GntR family transcriptional regulator